jgi:hypothetical protein
LLIFPGVTQAQFGGMGGGGFGGGGFGGGGFGGGGGGFGGGGGLSGSSTTFSTTLTSQGFRPTPSYSSGGFGGGRSSSTGMMGGAMGMGMMGGSMMGGSMMGGQMNGMGMMGGGMLGNQQIVKTKISGAAMGESLKAPVAAFPELEAKLEKLLANATNVSSGRLIEVDMQQPFQEKQADGTVREVGPVILLRGTVNSAYEKQLAESFARLEPGVHEIRNELTVAAKRRRQ